MTDPSAIDRPVEQKIVVSRLVKAMKDLPGLIVIGVAIAILIWS